jgi:hypothetical protein
MESVASSPAATSAAPPAVSMADINVKALKTSITNARAAISKPTTAAALAEAVNAAVSLAGDTIKPKLTTDEWSGIGVANYQLQIDVGNGKGLTVVLPAAQNIIVLVERAGAKAGVL